MVPSVLEYSEILDTQLQWRRMAFKKLIKY